MPLFYINNQIRAGYDTADRMCGISFHVAHNVIDVSRGDPAPLLTFNLLFCFFNIHIYV